METEAAPLNEATLSMGAAPTCHKQLRMIRVGSHASSAGSLASGGTGSKKRRLRKPLPSGDVATEITLAQTLSAFCPCYYSCATLAGGDAAAIQGKRGASQGGASESERSLSLGGVLQRRRVHGPAGMSPIPLLLEPAPNDTMLSCAIVSTHSTKDTGLAPAALLVLCARNGVHIYRPQPQPTDSDLHRLSTPWLLQEHRSDAVYRDAYLVAALSNHIDAAPSSDCCAAPLSHRRYFGFASLQKAAADDVSAVHRGEAHHVAVSSCASHFIVSHALHGSNRVVAIALASLHLPYTYVASSGNRTTSLPMVVSVDEEGRVCCMDVAHACFVEATTLDAYVPNHVTRKLSTEFAGSDQSNSFGNVGGCCTSTLSSTSDMGGLVADPATSYGGRPPLFPFIACGGRLRAIALRICNPCDDVCNDCIDVASDALADGWVPFSVFVSICLEEASSAGGAEGRSSAAQSTVVCLRMRYLARGVNPSAVVVSVGVIQTSSAVVAPSTYAGAPAIALMPRQLLAAGSNELPLSCDGHSKLLSVFVAVPRYRMVAMLPCTGAPSQRGGPRGVLGLINESGVSSGVLASGEFLFLRYMGAQLVATGDASQEEGAEGHGAGGNIVVQTNTDGTTVAVPRGYEWWPTCCVGYTTTGIVLLLGYRRAPVEVVQHGVPVAATMPDGGGSIGFREGVTALQAAHDSVEVTDVMSDCDRVTLDAWLDDVAEVPVVPQAKDAQGPSPEVILPVRLRRHGAAVSPTSSNFSPLAQGPHHRETESAGAHLGLQTLHVVAYQSNPATDGLSAPVDVQCVGNTAYLVFAGGVVEALPLPILHPSCAADRKQSSPSISAATQRQASNPAVEWTQLKAQGKQGSLLHLMTSVAHGMHVPRVVAGHRGGPSSAARLVASMLFGGAPLVAGDDADVRLNGHNAQRDASQQVEDDRSVTPGRSSSRSDSASLSRGSMASSRRTTTTTIRVKTRVSPQHTDTTAIDRLLVDDIVPQQVPIAAKALWQPDSDPPTIHDRAQVERWEAAVASLSTIQTSEEPAARNHLHYEELSEWLALSTHCDTAVQRQRAADLKRNPPVQDTTTLKWGDIATGAVTTPVPAGFTIQLHRATFEVVHLYCTSARFLRQWRHRRLHTKEPALRQQPWVKEYLAHGPQVSALPPWLLSMQDADRCQFELRDLQLRQDETMQRLVERDVVQVMENQYRKTTDPSCAWKPFTRCPFQGADGLPIDVEALNVQGTAGCMHATGWAWADELDGHSSSGSSPSSRSQRHRGALSPADDVGNSGGVVAAPPSLQKWAQASPWAYAMTWPPTEPGDAAHWSAPEATSLVRRRGFQRERVDLKVSKERSALRAAHEKEQEQLKADLGMA